VKNTENTASRKDGLAMNKQIYTPHSPYYTAKARAEVD
jgi:hypothetical protein